LNALLVSSEKRTRRKSKKCQKQKQSHQQTEYPHDVEYEKYKRYMKMKKTSIIEFKKQRNPGTDTTAVKEQREQIRAKALYDLYRRVMLQPSMKTDKFALTLILYKMIPFIPRKYRCTSAHECASKDDVKQCQVCFDGDNALVSMTTYCQHRMICAECFANYLHVLIKDGEHILPWLLCPAPDCKAPIESDVILQYIGINDLFQFCAAFIHKHLQRSRYFIQCPDHNDKKCQFGWIMINNRDPNYYADDYRDADEDADIGLVCKSCGCEHVIKRDQHQNQGKSGDNDGFAAMVKQGVLRECPKCRYPAFKDYGMCNVMHCAKCSIYWNWRTKQTGNSSAEVKEQARAQGTLWEPGELSYQMNLQHTNLPEFIKLLARNGIRYDPNYRRGT
jgi:hypothetical protein